MGLFDKQNAQKSNKDPYEERVKELKAEKIRITRTIGELFIEENRDSDLSETKYADLFEKLFENERQTELNEKQQLASKGLRKCEKCGAELPINSSFCNKCGAKQGELESEVVKTGKICPKCGEKLDEGDVFCINCGYKL